MKRLNLDLYFPSDYNEFNSKFLLTSKSIIDLMKSIFSYWIKEHDLKNEDNRFDSMYEYLLENSTIYDDINNNKYSGQYIDIDDAIQRNSQFDCNLSKIMIYMSDEDIIPFFENYFETTSYDLWIEYIDEKLDMEENDFDEDIDSENDSEKNSIEERKEILYDSYNESELINHLINLDQDYFSKGIQKFFNSKEVKNAMLNWWKSEGSNDLEERWEIDKANSDNGSEYSNQQLVQFAKDALNRLESVYGSNNFEEVMTSITLALNVQHNFGKLFADHLDEENLTNLDEEQLHELSNLDTSEWREIIDGYIKLTGKTYQQLLDEKTIKDKNEKYKKQRMNELWQWKTDREQLGKWSKKLNWYRLSRVF